MPRYAPSTQSTPSSLKVGTSGSSGWRCSIATASARTLPLLLIANARVGHAAVDMAAEHRHRHVAGALERHVGGLDAERRVHALVRGVVGRVQARAAEVELAGSRLARP